MHRSAARFALATSAPTSGAKLRRKLTDAFDPLRLGTEFFVKQDLLEFRQPVFETRFQVGLIKEFRVGEPCADNALVAGDDGVAAVFGFDVGDENEFVGQSRSGRIAQHEALLVVADGGADHFAGDLQESHIERARQNHRPFDKARHFGEKAIVLDQFEALREGKLLCLGDDDVAPPRGVEHHFGPVEFLLVVVEPANGKRRRREKAVAARLVARDDATDRKWHHVGLFGLRAESRNNRMERPHPRERARVLRAHAPAHRFRPREFYDHVGENFADHVERGAAGLLDHGDIKVALFVRLDFRVGNRFQAGRFQEAGDGVVRRTDARAFFLLTHVGLPRRYAVHGEREPPRRHERFGALVHQPGLDQPVGDELAQIVRRARLHARGDFLGEKLKQKIGHGSAATLLREKEKITGSCECRRTSAFSTSVCRRKTTRHRTLPACIRPA